MISCFWKGLSGILVAVLIVGQWSTVADAEEQVILEISGNVSVDGEVLFTRSALEALGSTEIATTTPWHDGVVRFEGVPLKSLLAHVGALGNDLTVFALNDYSATIPMKDLEEFNPILALKLNGKHMGVEDKGPLFVIYPFDSDTKLQSEIYFSRSVWQANKILVK
ncbi:molybdopterin-dependent oxidoreductase [Labrenzia sp. PHM005]|uniref:molybdopterin-dependent oxidoreductase n=1 Tax=Labrenzia sp. PHM005 TaxID=2590016 RepID=UPI0011408C87|nr:molybdopterin-dependent oxidoreductase [Labrenzia sp. PHM005]QDG77260.1 oxidoreductase [Labrenzia sp. PHM005]